MRLGGVLFKAVDLEGLEGLLPTLDRYGLSAIPAPPSIDEMTLDEVREFGELAQQRGLVIGESMVHCNLMSSDPTTRATSIQHVRDRLHRADLMGCKCIVLGVGGLQQVDGFDVLDPYMFSRNCMKEFELLIGQVLEDVDPTGRTKLSVEPTNRSFYSEPEAMAELVALVGHPRFAVHLDLANLISQSNYFDNTALINRTFQLLSPVIASAHFKDIRWDPRYYSVKLDEVEIGVGVLDYPTYLEKLNELDDNLTCYCEHLKTEEEYARNFSTLHALAAKIGTQFVPRSVTTQ